MRFSAKETKVLRRGEEPEWEDFFALLPRKIEKNDHGKIDKPVWVWLETIERKCIGGGFACSPTVFMPPRYTYRLKS